MSTWKMAWRNIWRNRRRTLVTIAAMSIAVFITVGYSGLVAGMVSQFESDTLDFELGAAQIFAPGYQDRPSIYTNMADTPAILARLDAAGVVATPRLLGAGLVAAGDSSGGAALFGIDLERDPRVLALSEQMMHGHWLDTADAKGVVIGRKLAHTLGVKPGDELVVLSQAVDGGMANDLFRVRGVLKTTGEQIDRAGVFMTAATFRALLDYRGGAHQIIVKRPAVLDTAALKAQVVAAAPGQDVQSWRDLSPMLATMIDSVMGLIAIFFLVINIAIGIVVLNAMLMAVFERIKEFGVLKALGISPGGVLGLIYVESAIQVALSIAAGVLLSLPVMWYLSTSGIDTAAMAGTSMMGISIMSTWYAVFSPEVYLQPVFMTVFVVAVAVFYPAYKAAVIQPVEAMRHQ
ncbi:MAG: ABC transporter permease [Deltaproteobacteria bacterium]|nr:ABC transporter permease [Deltaproteobacteria bacterium]